ncbi:hypothetical protein [Corynebacterium pseudotuberculosis]|uniref:hypothetical protein n=1 Tax=Corynebacterium pseudotuberculosis TaxID=1719 RepID=UPI001F19BF2E|nr:hypothetical protein [Corynebacterium pseudotuberculosis]
MFVFLLDVIFAITTKVNVHAAGSAVIEIILLINLSIFTSRGRWVREMDRNKNFIIVGSESFAPERLFLLGLTILFLSCLFLTIFALQEKNGLEELFQVIFSIGPVKWAVTLTVTVPLYEVFGRGWGELKAQGENGVLYCKPFVSSAEKSKTFCSESINAYQRLVVAEAMRLAPSLARPHCV